MGALMYPEGRGRNMRHGITYFPCVLHVSCFSSGRVALSPKVGREESRKSVSVVACGGRNS